MVGLAKDFYRKLGKHYGRLEQWVFEPSVASKYMNGYLNEKGITQLNEYRMERIYRDRDRRITSILVKNKDGKGIWVQAKYYIDCSYEGDLMAAAGISHTIGREPNSMYKEDYNGVQLLDKHQFPDGIDPYRVKGDSSSGLLWGISAAKLASQGSGDALVQAYNFRICLSSDPKNRIPITRPANYDSTRYDLLVRLMEKQTEKTSLQDYFIWSKMPNNKTDINNRGGFSTDLIGGSHAYPTANAAQRAQIIREHTDYTKGLLYFFGHDRRVPQKLRNEMLTWGYPKDEFRKNGNFSPQLYVREARRMIGSYVVSQADCQGKTSPKDGIAFAAYTMDSHNCQRIVVKKDGMNMVKNEGDVQIKGGAPYPISYRAILPNKSECKNLLVPVCLSASHIAYGSIRMEPVFMVLGQISAMAACKAIDAGNKNIQEVNYKDLNTMMAENPYLNHSAPDIIVDNADTTCILSKGWQIKKSNDGYGGSFAELKSSDTTEYALFTAHISRDARYSIYVYQQTDKKQSPSTELEIGLTKKDESTPVIQHKTLKMSNLKVIGQTKGDWVFVDKSELKAGDRIQVKILNRNSGPIHADAILLVAE